MSFFPKSFKSIKIKNKLSFFILFSIVTILFVGYLFLEKKIYIESVAVFLFVLSIVQVLALQYFFKNQLKNDVIKDNLKLRIDEFKEDLEIFDNESDHTYLSNMSYEVRTPLNTVLGMLDMLKQTDLNSDQSLKLEIAEYSSKHLLQLFNMVINNAEIGAKEFKLNLSTVDLKLDLTKLFKVFEYQAWERDLDFEYEFLSEEKKDRFLVLTDSERIQLILINLVNNAIKFTESGKISIIVDQTIEIDDHQIITFYIKDTGLGMTPEEIIHFFDNSVKATSNKFSLNEHRGWGVGLSISYQLVKLMGGELKLESKESEGSTFYFSLQLKKTLNIKTQEEVFSPVLFEKFNVLVAEDNRTNQKVIKFLLEREGAQCTFAKNGLEALQLYKILDFDMIFMDIYMPDMDGYEATKFIKETDKYALKTTPIIAVSASAFDEDIEKAKLSGIDDFLAKPIEVKKLKELLIKYSKKSSV
ncbi:Signal transduction histidine kinase [Flaviramulus basaltis]|uniref:histidine kinase n=1 Tax=Flaviramulus basaltis TaxID=369401 RepID=A0A1K2IHB2_9FLAO|nr:response regulator [Flaviramulus basaltis]SFZ91817.1 Signal transduction histidine kinase [Flaviramulus basaltis]